MTNVPDYLTNISFATYLVVYLGGLATSITPCVYPLIPIIAGTIGSSQEKSRLKSFVLSLLYVLGMACTFSILGVLAAMTGKIFGQIQSSPLAHLIVGNVIILFGLALLDVIPMPVFLLSRAGAGKVMKGGSNLSVFFMGAISGLIAAPCTAAVLGALLAYVASKQNVAIGFTLMFTFALGVGSFLVLIGTFTGILTGFKKSERLAQILQKIMALAMIIVGEYFVFKAGMLNF